MLRYNIDYRYSRRPFKILLCPRWAWKYWKTGFSISEYIFGRLNKKEFKKIKKNEG